MKRFIACSLVLFIAMWAAAVPVLALPTEQILTAVYDSTTSAININFSGWVQALDLSDETALTNTIHPILDLTHTTSGTAANGIGESIRFTQEVTSGNEIAGQIGVLAADVTAASEDFDYVLYLMTAGAAMAEVYRVTSTGVVTLVNDATIDNSTNGTLLLAEPVVEVSAAFLPNFVTADPCGTYPEGSIFYNSTGNFPCFCDDSGDDVKTTDNSTACF